MSGGEEWAYQLLLKAGADIETKDMNGSTPLNWAESKGRAEMVELLLKVDAEKNGSVSLSWARGMGMNRWSTAVESRC